MRITRHLLFILLLAGSGVQAAEPDATALVRRAYDNWRGNNSYTELTMTIHRPDWERSLSMQSWMRGENDALVRFTAPVRDTGNATLKLDSDMWLFNPKLNQIIHLPTSMMAQAWMGSDFSYNDLARANSVVKDYDHRLTGTQQQGGHRVYTVEATPKPAAPVVWGKEVLRIRDDGVLLEEQFYDQDMHPVKDLVTTRVGPLDGQPYPLVMEMHASGQSARWTRITVTRGRLNLELPAFLFTQSNLRNPRPWSLP